MAAIPSSHGFENIFKGAERRLRGGEWIVAGKCLARQAIRQSALGIVLDDGEEDEETLNDVLRTPVSVITSALATAICGSAIDAGIWMGLTQSLELLVGKREVLLPVACWGIQSVLREYRSSSEDFKIDFRHNLHTAMSRRIARSSHQIAIDVLKNTSTLLSAMYATPWALANFPSLEEGPRKLHLLTQAVIPFVSMTAVESALTLKLPPMSSTCSNFVWYAAVQCAFTPITKPTGVSPYIVMGLESSASTALVKQRYREVSIANHPDNLVSGTGIDLKGYSFADFTRSYNEIMKRRGGRGR